MGISTTLHKILHNEDDEDIPNLLLSENFKFRRAGAGSIWVESGSCTPCSFFSSSFLDILGSRALCNDKVQYRILLPSVKDLRSLESKMKSAGIHYEIIGIIPYVHKELTDRQREILRMAMEHGYFEDGQRTSLTQLAEIIGMSPSSLSEILRRSLKKSVSFYFDHRP